MLARLMFWHFESLYPGRIIYTVFVTTASYKKTLPFPERVTTEVSRLFQEIFRNLVLYGLYSVHLRYGHAFSWQWIHRCLYKVSKYFESVSHETFECIYFCTHGMYGALWVSSKCLFGWCSNTQLYLGLSFYSLLYFNCRILMICLHTSNVAVVCFATTGCLYPTGCLAKPYTGNFNQSLHLCLCLNLAWTSYVLTCRLYPRYSVSGFCYNSLCYKQLPLLHQMSRTESKGERGR